MKVTDKKLEDFAVEKLEEAREALDDHGAAGEEVLAPVEMALMALYLWAPPTPESITLHPADVLEYIDPPKGTCICPPGLAERGGFRGGCPIHHTH